MADESTQGTPVTNNTPANADILLSQIADAEAAKVATEAPKEEVKVEEPKKEDRQTSKLTELARKEWKLEQDRKAIRAEKAELENYKKSIAKLKTNPMDFLEEHGYDTQAIIDRALEKIGGTPNPKKEDPLLSKVDEKLKALEEREKAAEAKLQSAQEAVVWNDHINKVTNYVNSNSDKYEVILSHPEKATQLYKETLNEVRNYALKEYGRDLEDSEVIAVINRVEDLMTSEYTPLFEKLSKLKKFSKNAKTEPDSSSKSTTEPVGIKTLTNNLADQANVPGIASSKPTDEERLAIIARMFPKRS